MERTRQFSGGEKGRLISRAPRSSWTLGINKTNYGPISYHFKDKDNFSSSLKCDVIKSKMGMNE